MLRQRQQVGKAHDPVAIKIPCQNVERAGVRGSRDGQRVVSIGQHRWPDGTGDVGERNGRRRSRWRDHMIQVSTSGATAQTFTIYTSADGNIWTAIRDHTDVDSTVAGYTGANASGVINLTGSYPWFRIATVADNSNPFSAVIYSTNRTTT